MTLRGIKPSRKTVQGLAPSKFADARSTGPMFVMVMLTKVGRFAALPFALISKWDAISVGKSDSMSN